MASRKHGNRLLAPREVGQRVAQVRQERGVLRAQGQCGVIGIHGLRRAPLRPEHQAEIAQGPRRLRFNLDRSAQACSGFPVPPHPVQQQSEIVVRHPVARVERQRLAKRRFCGFERPHLP